MTQVVTPRRRVQCTNVPQPLRQHSPPAVPSLHSSSPYTQEGMSHAKPLGLCGFKSVSCFPPVHLHWVWADRRSPLAVPIWTGTLQCPHHVLDHVCTWLWLWHWAPEVSEWHTLGTFVLVHWKCQGMYPGTEPTSFLMDGPKHGFRYGKAVLSQPQCFCPMSWTIGS